MSVQKTENHKQYLADKSKTAKVELDKLKTRISKEKKRFKQIVERHESLINDLTGVGKEYKKEIEQVATEYSYRRKINALLKKHDYLRVFWDGDEDGYTTWVYSDDFGGDEYHEGDPFGDEHFCDDYEEAYERCLEYINHHDGVAL